MITVNVHSFLLADVEDPELYAAEPLLAWEKSDHGQWVMANAAETPTWNMIADPMTYGHRVVIRAKLTEENATYYMLKWARNDSNRSL